MHGVATLVRLCLMPNHHERPSLADIVARVRHDALFSTFSCDTVDEVLLGIESEFWLWSPSIHEKLMGAMSSGQLSDKDALLGIPDKVSLTHRLLAQCRRHADTPEALLLPLEALVAVLRAFAPRRGSKKESQIPAVISPEDRSFVVGTALALAGENTPRVTLLLLEAASLILEATPKAANYAEERWAELFSHAVSG
jgi:hypothetical protein